MKTIYFTIFFFLFSLNLFSQELYLVDNKRTFIENKIKKEFKIINKKKCDNDDSKIKLFIFYWTTIKKGNKMGKKNIDKNFLENNIEFYGNNINSKIKHPSFGFIYRDNKILYSFNELGSFFLPNESEIDFLNKIIQNNFKYGFVINNINEPNIYFFIDKYHEIYVIKDEESSNPIKLDLANLTCCFPL